MISSLDSPKKVVLELVYDILDDKENEGKPLIQFNSSPKTKLKLVSPNFGKYYNLTPNTTEIDENNSTTYDSSIRDLHCLYQNLDEEEENEGVDNLLDKLVNLSIQPIVVPNYQIHDEDPISLNFIRLLMTYNKLLKLVVDKNHQINLIHVQKKIILENIKRQLDDYYSSSDNEITSPLRTHFDEEEFDNTNESVDG